MRREGLGEYGAVPSGLHKVEPASASSSVVDS